jgi:hypothetical protein
MYTSSIFVAVLSLALVGCKSQPELTSLQKQELETREFETAKRPTFNGCVSVLQDLGYIIDTADFDTGVISAHGESHTTFFPPGESQSKVSIFVQEWGAGKAKVRATFVEHSTSHGQYGSSETDETVYDSVVYRNFFDELGKALFVNQAIAPKSP